MRLTVQTDYALRTLMFLASQNDTQKIDDIARVYDISKNHLMKVVQRLAAAGFVNSQRGRGGGLTLAGEADQINIGAVVRAMEKTDEFVECQMGADNHCIVTPVCGLKHMLGDAVEAFFEHLDQYTLADVIGKKAEFQKIFAVA